MTPFQLIPHYIRTELGFQITDEEFFKFESVFPEITFNTSQYMIGYLCHGKLVAYQSISDSGASLEYTKEFYNRFQSLILSLCQMTITAKMNKQIAILE